jgi:tetratricopeptide (TPR) repeat protein/predicted aspartyl protease
MAWKDSMGNIRKPSPRRVRSCIAVLAVLCGAAPTATLAACKLGKMVEFPVSMAGLRPLITAKINDQDVQFLFDSGAFYSMISAASAAQLNLKLSPAPLGLRVTGLNGSVNTSVANVKVLTLGGFPIKNVEFLVGGSDVQGGSVGLLGQNFIRIGDVEYDLAKGVIRLMHADGCSNALLAYWVKAGEPYSVIKIDSVTPLEPHTISTAYVNGAEVRVTFDTGAPTSMLSLKAAARAGVKPDSPGVVAAGYSGGVGRSSYKTYIGPFASFKIGEEEVRNTRLRFGDMTLENADMLLGADFFLSHRIYVASSQRKLYFTFNGGHVFNLSSGTAPTPAAEPAGGTPPADQPKADEPVDAAAYSRRGAAAAARHDYENALADLTRACELAPDKSEYFYQRGVAYRESQQFAPAMSDFNRALELNPDDLSALTARAALRMGGHDNAGATADLDAVDRHAPKEADVRLFLAQGYEHLDLLSRSVAQYDLWIISHRDDARMALALNGRCGERALFGEDLANALGDCNAALKLTDKSSPAFGRILDSRALVRLRMGDFDRAIADYDDSLKLIPKNAWSLYGRGIAKTRKNRIAEGEADMAAATAIWAPVEEQFKRRGISR